MVVCSKDRLVKQKKLILFIETAALLHDIGKLSKAFIEYRQAWQYQRNGYFADPHLGQKFKQAERLKIPDVFELELRKVDNEITMSDDKVREFCKRKEWCDEKAIKKAFLGFSILKVICDHENPGNDDFLMGIIKTADSNDSAIDRNNPFFSSEQIKDQEAVFRSNVFGHESCTIDVDGLEKAREDLYEGLGQHLPQYFAVKNGFTEDDRQKLIKITQRAFCNGLSDTCRPQNDTTLWDHAYAVAAIAKVLIVHNLFSDDLILSAFDENFRYGIWGAGWDGLRFLSYGQKIGDIVARKKIIEDIKNAIRPIVEYRYPVGNSIYEDDDGIYFIVPAGFGDVEGSPFEKVCKEIEQEISEIVGRKSNGEIEAAFRREKSCRQLTALAGVIDAMRRKTAFRFHSQQKFLELQEFKDGMEVCPICRLRPVQNDVDEKICQVCLQRRRDASIDRQKSQTIFLDEIVDKNGRAALLVARFDLRKWLNGDMIRTLFVSEARSIEKEIKSLNTIEDFKCDGEQEVKGALKGRSYNYCTICEDIDALLKEDADNDDHARNIAFLYTHGRHGCVPATDLNNKRSSLTKFIENCKQEHNARSSGKNGWQDVWTYNVINAKSPTPSTLFDVWRTTQSFFQHEAQTLVEKDCGPVFRRIRLKFLSGNNLPEGKRAIEGKLVGEKVDLLVVPGKGAVDVILPRHRIAAFRQKLQSRTDVALEIDGDHYKVQLSVDGLDLKPYRVITASPLVFMAIVPADQALLLTDEIYKTYQLQMGKVTGRLPFGMADVYFKKRLPMFVVLDAARRIINNFLESTSIPLPFTVGSIKTDRSNIKLKVQPEPEKRSITLQVPVKLGQHEKDYYYPYMLLPGGYEMRKGYFKTIAGNAMPVLDLQEQDKIFVYPNFFDFVFLDSNQRRHEINLPVLQKPPFFMEEVSQLFIEMWDKINNSCFSHMTQAKLKNIEALWAAKANLWGSDSEAFKKLVTATLNKEFPKIATDIQERIIEMAINGAFFRLLELQQGILKKAVRQMA